MIRELVNTLGAVHQIEELQTGVPVGFWKAEPQERPD